MACPFIVCFGVELDFGHAAGFTISNWWGVPRPCVGGQSWGEPRGAPPPQRLHVNLGNALKGQS